MESNTTIVPSCIVCATNNISNEFEQQDEIIFFAKLLKNALNHDGEDSDEIVNLVPLVPSVYVFCCNCYDKVVEAKESYGELNKLRQSLRQAQAEVQSKVLSSYYSSTSSTATSNYVDRVRSDLVQRLIFDVTTDGLAKEDVAKPEPEEPTPSFTILGFEDSMEEDDDLDFPVPAPNDGEEPNNVYQVPQFPSRSSSFVSRVKERHENEVEKESSKYCRECSVNLGSRVVPFKCLSSKCRAEFWTAVLLRHHLKSHRKTSQHQSKNVGRRIVVVERQDHMHHKRRIGTVKFNSAESRKRRIAARRAERRRERRRLRIEAQPKSELTVLLDKMKTTTFPAECPLEYCDSKTKFTVAENLRLHIKRIHWDLHPVPPKRIPKGVTETEIEVMMSLHTRPLPSKCPLDDCWLAETYETLKQLQNHVRQHYYAFKMHGEEQPPAMRRELYAAQFLNFPLETCVQTSCSSKTVFKKREIYKRHIRQVHFKKGSTPSVNFDPENKLFLTLQAHFRRVQEMTLPAKCFIDGCTEETYFEQDYDLRLHIKTNHFNDVQEETQYVHGVVDKKKELLEMLGKMSYPAKCSVENCEKEFSSRTKLRRHLESHFGDRSFVRAKVQDLENEIQCAEKQNSSFAQEHACDECNRKFHTMKSLRNHKAQAHKTEAAGKYKCDYCDKVFMSKGGLAAHRRGVHLSNSETFLCSFCPKTFKMESYLKNHLLRHSGNYKYFCGCCPCGFHRRTELEEHERGSHWKELGIQPIQCDVCGKMFARMSTLTGHKKSHNSEAAFSCDQCDYKTGLRNDMKEHTASVHSTATPFVCPTCGKAYKLERRLRRHQRYHVMEYPHQCLVCNGRHFSTARQLRVHNERKHGLAPSSSPRGVLAEDFYIF